MSPVMNIFFSKLLLAPVFSTPPKAIIIHSNAQRNLRQAPHLVLSLLPKSSQERTSEDVMPLFSNHLLSFTPAAATHESRPHRLLLGLLQPVLSPPCNSSPCSQSTFFQIWPGPSCLYPLGGFPCPLFKVYTL